MGGGLARGTGGDWHECRIEGRGRLTATARGGGQLSREMRQSLRLCGNNELTSPTGQSSRKLVKRDGCGEDGGMRKMNPRHAAGEGRLELLSNLGVLDRRHTFPHALDASKIDVSVTGSEVDRVARVVQVVGW